MDDLYDIDDIEHQQDVTRLDHIPTVLHNLPSKMPRNVTYRKRKSLPPHYQPGEFDVCCGRGKRHWNHIGNVRFRKIIQSSVERYMDAPTKNDKTAVVVSIVDDIRNFGGNFLKEDLHGTWYDIGDQQARDKVGHSLRDQVTTINRQRRKETAMQQLINHSSPAPANNISNHRPQPSNFTNGIMMNANNNNANNYESMNMDPNPLNPMSSMQPPVQQQTTQQQQQQMMMNMNQNSPMDYSQQQQPPMPEPQSFNFSSIVNTTNSNSLSSSLTPIPLSEISFPEEEEEDAESDGENELTNRRNTLSSSLIIDRFTRRPSFASAVHDPSNSVKSSGTVRSSGMRSSTVRNSSRSGGWSFLQDMDFDLEGYDLNSAETLEPLAL